MGLRIDQKIVLVTRPTQLVGLRKRFNTTQQAEFYIQRLAEIEIAKEAPTASVARAKTLAAKEKFQDILHEDETYDDAVSILKRDLKDLMYVQVIGRELLPN